MKRNWLILPALLLLAPIANATRMNAEASPVGNTDPQLSFDNGDTYTLYLSDISEEYAFPNNTLISTLDDDRPSLNDVTYTSSEPSIATVDDSGSVSIFNVGETTITANYPGNETYAPVELSYKLIVELLRPLDEGATTLREPVIFDESHEEFYNSYYTSADCNIETEFITIMYDTGYTISYERTYEGIETQEFGDLEMTTSSDGRYQTAVVYPYGKEHEHYTAGELTLTVSDNSSNMTSEPLHIVFSTPTGIEEVSNDSAAATYYNLQGVRVANPEHGIFIRVQGSKVGKVRV